MTNDRAATQAPVAKQDRTLWAWTIATFFGVGLGKPGPGTWGSVATVLLWTALAVGLHPSAPSLIALTLADYLAA